MGSKKKYYAVAVGKVPGIYTQWFGNGGAEQMIRGFRGAVYKGFATMEEARAFLQAHKGAKRISRPAAAKRVSPRIGPPAEPATASPPQAGQVVMYTDGGALNNPGPGGYGVIIIEGENSRELSRGYRHTTNNRMELMACIAGLGAFRSPRSVILHSDSQYVINGITKGWARKWKAKGWVKSNGEPAINPDLWDELLALCDKHDVTFRWVKGHAGIDGNERCDQLARQAASGRDLSIDIVYEKNRRA
jgi:ribonuclease HI